MADSSTQPTYDQPRDAAYWAQPVSKLKVSEMPPEAVNLNVEGRQVVGPLQGFGQMWQKTYRIRLSAANVTPMEVMKLWKERFPTFMPDDSRFYPPMVGVQPGEVLLINASVAGMPVDTGVMVLYADDVSFTVMTPEGHPESGFNTFSAYEEDGTVVAQVQSLARANDPIYEFGFRFMGGSKVQERIWHHVLTSLAAQFGVQGPVEMQKVCVDPRLQWRQAKNIWQNAQVRTVLYTLTAPLRWLRRNS